jgi:hypothetical protein
VLSVSNPVSVVVALGDLLLLDRLPQPLGFYCPEATTSPIGCQRGTYGSQTRLTEAAFCSACLPSQTSYPGSVSCTMCMQSYYKVEINSTVASSSFECRPCLSGGVTCNESTALASVALAPGRWRLSSTSEEVAKCFFLSPDGTSHASDARVADGDSADATWWSPCKGGVAAGLEGEGYCQVGYAGPLCERCTNSSKYFLARKGRCVDCPALEGRVLLIIGPARGAISLLACAAVSAARVAPRMYKTLARWFNQFKILSTVALIPKLKVPSPRCRILNPNIFRTLH